MSVNQTSETIDGTTYTYAIDGTYGPRTWNKWYRCVLCALSFPENKVQFFQGKAYGVPCGCYKDIPDLRRKGRAT